jgi:hypothetical protein
MSTKSQRYGKGFEYEVRDLLRESSGLAEFERTPHSGSLFGGSNKYKVDKSRDDAVELLSGDLMCPENWRWTVECKNHEDVPIHQLFLGGNSETIDEFLAQTHESATTAGKEPLLFIKWRKKGWKLPDKVKKLLKAANIDIPTGNSITMGIMVAELKEKCLDIEHINHICYTSKYNTIWCFFDYENWKLNIKNRQNVV